MVHFVRFSASMICLLALVACAPPVVKEAPEDERINEVLRKVRDNTSVAVNAQRELAMAAHAKADREVMMRKRLLTDLVSYDFYGPVEEILGAIAQKYEYQFQVFGKRPPEGVNVNVFVTRKTVLDCLKLIGNQSGDLFDVELTETAIVLKYRPVPVVLDGAVMPRRSRSPAVDE